MPAIASICHAAASLRSVRYLQIDGAVLKVLRSDQRFLPGAGRALLLHCNFSNHRAAALRTLGLPMDAGREALSDAVREWDAYKLEDEVHAAGGCAAAVRNSEEWSRHPQSTAVASLPLIEIDRIGDAPQELLRAATRPLSGVRVLDLTRVLAGPTCAKALAEHGADVLKISGPHLPHSGEVEIDTGLGKLSAFLDLRYSADLETLFSPAIQTAAATCSRNPTGQDRSHARPRCRNSGRFAPRDRMRRVERLGSLRTVGAATRV
jgi:hypothetical protein